MLVESLTSVTCQSVPVATIEQRPVASPKDPTRVPLSFLTHSWGRLQVRTELQVFLLPNPILRLSSGFS